MALTSAGYPAMCATTIALVYGVTSASICSGPGDRDPGATSATIGMQFSSGMGIIPPGSVRQPDDDLRERLHAQGLQGDVQGGRA